MDEQHRAWMRLAVDEAKRSVAEDRRDAPPRVGVVIVKDGAILGSAHRGQAGSGCHAEYGLLMRLAGLDLSGADVFTTLEPCSRRSPEKVPCARRLIDAKVSRVWIGMYDPNPRIYREGWRMIREAGIELRDFAPELRAELAAVNVAFLDGFRTAHGEEGRARFNPLDNDGYFTITTGDRAFRTRWSQRSATSCYALSQEEHVALAKDARSFDVIDDPAALDWSSWSRPVEQGQIVAFRDGHRGYLLVQLIDVQNFDRAADRNELEIRWELRAPLP